MSFDGHFVASLPYTGTIRRDLGRVRTVTAPVNPNTQTEKRTNNGTGYLNSGRYLDSGQYLGSFRGPVIGLTMGKTLWHRVN